MDDPELCAALAEDLAAGFEQLAWASKDRLYAFALRMTGNPSAAEDIVQETLTRAWTALRAYTPERRRALRLRPWLFQITVNITRNQARSTRRARVTLLGDADERATLRIPDTDPHANPEMAATREQEIATLGQALLTLPSPHRVAVTLRHIEGMGYTAIAEVTGLPIGTVKSHVSRGVAELRKTLEREHAREWREQEEVRP